MEASLVDEFSSLELIFYVDSTFEQRANSFMGKNVENSGTFILKGKEIWLNGKLSKKITPDFLYIENDKLIWKNNAKGKSDTTFSSYYRIRKNGI